MPTTQTAPASVELADTAPEGADFHWEWIVGRGWVAMQGASRPCKYCGTPGCEGLDLC